MERESMMQVEISGTNVEIGQALITHISGRIRESAGKYFPRPIDATVTVSREGPMYRVDCAVHAISGANLYSHAEDLDVYASFDQAAEKLEKQLRRFKRRITNHHDS